MLVSSNACSSIVTRHSDADIVNHLLRPVPSNAWNRHSLQLSRTSSITLDNVAIQRLRFQMIILDSSSFESISTHKLNVCCHKPLLHTNSLTAEAGAYPSSALGYAESPERIQTGMHIYNARMPQRQSVDPTQLGFQTDC